MAVKRIDKVEFYLMLFILFITLILSCRTKYYYYKNFERIEQLILNKDKSFERRVVFMNVRDTFKGSYISKKDTIILNFQTPKVFYLDSTEGIVKEYKCFNKDSLYFKVKISSHNCVSYFTIYFNDNYKDGIFAKDSLKIKRFKINSFYISTFQCVASYYYKVKNIENNCFDIEVYCQDSIYPNILRINPINKYLKVGFKLIPIINDTPRKEFTLKRKFVIKKDKR